MSRASRWRWRRRRRFKRRWRTGTASTSVMVPQVLQQPPIRTADVLPPEYRYHTASPTWPSNEVEPSGFWYWLFKPTNPLTSPEPVIAQRGLRRWIGMALVWEYSIAPQGQIRRILRTGMLVLFLVLVVGGILLVVLPIILAIVTVIMEILYALFMELVYLVGFILLAGALVSKKR